MMSRLAQPAAGMEASYDKRSPRPLEKFQRYMADLCTSVLKAGSLQASSQFRQPDPDR
jgi:hypothetical protein